MSMLPVTIATRCDENLYVIDARSPWRLLGVRVV